MGTAEMECPYLLFIDLKIIAKLTSYTRCVFTFALLKWSKYVRV